MHRSRIPLVLRRSICLWKNPSLSLVAKLRQQLQKEERLNVPRMTTLQTEKRLLTTLVRSPHPVERREGFNRGEKVWKELSDDGGCIPTPSRTAMRVQLSSSLRAAALMENNSEEAAKWSMRLAQRVSRLTPDAFRHTEEDTAAWAARGSTREQLRPGTGITAEDLEADAREEAAANVEDGRCPPKKSRIAPLERHRQAMMRDQPMMQWAFGQSTEPGPRWT